MADPCVCCHGVVDAPEGELVSIAERVMVRAGASWRNCRVVFVTGHRRGDETVHDDEVFGVVTQGDLVFRPGPGHPGFDPGSQPSIEPQPKPRGDKPWKDHGLAMRQVVECGSCRSDITVILVRGHAILVSTAENMRGTALICQGCGRLLCIDCTRPVEDLLTSPYHPKCDRCGGIVGPLATAEDQAAQTRSRVAKQSSQAVESTSQVTKSGKYAGYKASEIVDHVVECRQSGRRENRIVQQILDGLRREYGHPACPLAASLERLAYGASGPPLFQESMEPDEVELVEAILNRLAGNTLTTGPIE